MYDGDGNRIPQIAVTTTTACPLHDLNPTGYPQVVEELTNGAVTRTYTYGLQRISQNQLISNTWTPSFYGYDGFGTVRQLTDSGGTITDTYDYDAFGNKINSWARTVATPNNYLYRGEQWDSDLGQYYLRARYYNPITGRFMGRDPEDGDPLDPSTLHKYLYAGGNPIGAWDPTGRSAIAATVIGESWDTAKAAAAVTLGLAIQCAYDLLASKHTTYVQLGLAGGIGFGTVHSTSLCTVGGSDPCQPYEDAIQQWMATVQKRYRDLERDWCGLYPWRGIGTGHNPKYPRAGTWFGHHWWYTNVAQAALRAAIEAAQQHGCPIPPEAYYWATIGPPSCPR